MPLENWPSLLTAARVPYSKPKISFSHNQVKIVSHFLQEEDNDDIASALNISDNTLRSQKFNIMLKLKLRRMSDIATLSISLLLNMISEVRSTRSGRSFVISSLFIE